MKKVVLRLDDIGRQSHAQIFNLVSRTLLTKTPLCLGWGGADLEALPVELADLLKVALRAELVEIWIHGYSRSQPSLANRDALLEELARGHQAVTRVLGCEPVGAALPYKGLSAEVMAAIQAKFPSYLAFETVCANFVLLSDQADPLGNKLPRLAYFRELFGKGEPDANVLLHTHPTHWSGADFRELGQCMELMVERGYVCVSTSQARGVDGPSGEGAPQGELIGWRTKNQALVAFWEREKPDILKRVDNFDSYYIKRYAADSEKHFVQTKREMFPFAPKRILDFGCGLGNWSVPFVLSGDCEQLVLSDVNPTIADALRAGLQHIGADRQCRVIDDDLLAQAAVPGFEVDLLVSSNTYNYVDPVVFFQLARNCVVSRGRLLLMVQTAAFNKLRYRMACRGRNRTIGAEVLSSELGMLLRRTGALFPRGVRHVFSQAEITKLACLNGFVAESKFVSIGEDRLEDRPLYECYLFRKADDTDGSPGFSAELLSACRQSMRGSFGSLALELTGGLCDYSSSYPRFDSGWKLPASQANDVLVGLKKSLEDLKQGITPLQAQQASSGNAAIDELVEKYNKLVEILKQPA